MNRLIVACLAIVSLLYCSCGSNQMVADTIYYNATIWTGDSTNPNASCLAVKDSQIVYVGTDSNAFRGINTELINVNGQLLVPGFGDNHVHFLMGGYGLESVQLKEVTSPQAFINTIADYIKAHPGNGWIQGGAWNHEAWGGELPRKEWIDSISKDRPVYISRYDGHVAFANSVVLKLAGITKATPVPFGGEIVLDEKGEPTGILKDEAMVLVDKIVPPMSEAELDQYTKIAAKHAVENGVTLVNDMGTYGGWTDMAAYKRAKSNGDLLMRLYSFVPLRDWQKLDSFVKKEGRGNNELKWGGLKGFVDGSIGAATAWFYDPYVHDKSKKGLIITDTSLLREWTLGADKAGLQVAVHAIGDHAIDFILDVYEEAEKNNQKDHRFRIEHAQHVSAAAIPRFGELRVIGSMHPYHLVDDGSFVFKRIDSARMARTYAFSSIQKTGGRISFGSDWNVAPLKPLLGIWAAVTRQTSDGMNPNGWFPSEKITVEEALRHYTIDNAYASFMENRVGLLKEGMLADFVILNQNILTIPPDQIKDTKVVKTVVNGKVVFQLK